MDCSMPVMDGHEACKKIKQMMIDKLIDKKVTIIA